MSLCQYCDSPTLCEACHSSFYEDSVPFEKPVATKKINIGSGEDAMLELFGSSNEVEATA